MPQLSRLLPLAITALLFAAPSASAETARSADDFVSSIGVNTHLTYDDTAYGNFNLVRERLRELGVRHIRDGLCGPCGWQHDRLNALAADGISSTLIVGTPTNRTGTLSENLAAVRGRIKSVAALEGPNEWDLFSGWSPNWVGDLRSYQDRLHDQVRGDAKLHGLPIVGPSLVGWDSRDKLGSLGGKIDVGNLHSYAGGRMPEANLSSEMTLAGKVSGQRAVVATETGYHNATSQKNNDHPPVDEATAGRYMPRMFLEYFRSGVKRTFSYELLDERPGRAAVDQEASFGLLRSDFSRKPAFVAVRNLIDLLADPGPAVAPAEVPVTLTQAPGDVRRLVLRKRDGRVYVALWRAVSRWDPATRKTIAVQPAATTVKLGMPVRSVKQYSPVDSAQGTAMNVTDGKVSLGLVSAPIVLEVTPVRADPPAAVAPEAGAPAPNNASPVPAAPAPRAPAAPVPPASAPIAAAAPSVSKPAAPSAKRKPTAAARKRKAAARKRLARKRAAAKRRAAARRRAVTRR